MIWEDVDDEQTVVIDNGSSLIKAGFAGESTPRSIFNSRVGFWNIETVLWGLPGQKAVYVDDELKGSVLSCVRIDNCIKHGVVKTGMEWKQFGIMHSTQSYLLLLKNILLSSLNLH